MICNKDISIIIPHRDSISLLPKLISSIPYDDRLEIIIVDNSLNRVTKEEIAVSREYKLIYSSPSRGAGGARNEGLSIAAGKWLLFADADDFFAPGAFEIFLSRTNSDADIIYTCMGGVYLDTGEKANRGDNYTNLVKGYINGEKSEDDLRLGFPSPCCKMIRRELVNHYNIRFDEIRAGNDIYFSTVSGFFARKIEAIGEITYIATVNRGSLTQRRDYEVTFARLYSKLHCNQFLRAHSFSKRQHSVMYEIIMSFRFGPRMTLSFFALLFKFKQNPFIGYKRWIHGLKVVNDINKKNRNYIIK